MFLLQHFVKIAAILSNVNLMHFMDQRDGIQIIGVILCESTLQVISKWCWMSEVILKLQRFPTQQTLFSFFVFFCARCMGSCWSHQSAVSYSPTDQRPLFRDEFTKISSPHRADIDRRWVPADRLSIYQCTVTSIVSEFHIPSVRPINSLLPLFCGSPTHRWCARICEWLHAHSDQRWWYGSHGYSLVLRVQVFCTIHSFPFFDHNLWFEISCQFSVDFDCFVISSHCPRSICFCVFLMDRYCDGDSHVDSSCIWCGWYIGDLWVVERSVFALTFWAIAVSLI